MKLHPHFLNTPVSKCPSCGREVDSASGVDTEHQPGPGDFSVCIWCASVNTFDGNLQLVKMDEAELFKWLLDPQVGPALNHAIENVKRLPK